MKKQIMELIEHEGNGDYIEGTSRVLISLSDAFNLIYKDMLEDSSKGYSSEQRITLEIKAYKMKSVGDKLYFLGTDLAFGEKYF